MKFAIDKRHPPEAIEELERIMLEHQEAVRGRYDYTHYAGPVELPPGDKIGTLQKDIIRGGSGGSVGGRGGAGGGGVPASSPGTVTAHPFPGGATIGGMTMDAWKKHMKDLLTDAGKGILAEYWSIKALPVPPKNKWQLVTDILESGVGGLSEADRERLRAEQEFWARLIGQYDRLPGA